MLELISIHIPKTGGQSFYHILQQVYGEEVSISYQRRDYEAVMAQHRRFEDGLGERIKVLHGHLYYREIKRLHRKSGAKVICWLRDPVERVISNFNFFKNQLLQPELNPTVASINAHRNDESLLEYASRNDTRNRMSQFLKGLKLEELYFIGFLENYEAGLHRLAHKLDWGEVAIPHINRSKSTAKPALSEQEIQQIRRWNRKDIQLYESAKALMGRG